MQSYAPNTESSQAEKQNGTLTVHSKKRLIIFPSTQPNSFWTEKLNYSRQGWVW